MWIYLLHTALVLYLCLYAIFRDAFLRKHYLLVLYCCVCYIFLCLIQTMYRHCVVRRKHEAINKPVSKLYDSDVESDVETEVDAEEASKLSRMSNFTDLCTYRPIYKVVSYTIGVIFITFLILFTVTSYYKKDLIMEEDARTSRLVMLITIFGVQGTVFIVAMYRKDCVPERTKSSYEPFDKIIRIPMRVFLSKYFAYLLMDSLYIVGSLFYQFASIYGLVTVYNMSEGDIQRFKEESKQDNIQALMIYTMLFANFCSVLIILEGFVRAYYVTKYALLGTFEKNWRRNMKACEYLLPNTEVDTLQDLSLALREKFKQPHLSKEEEKAIQYIVRPLWKTKRAFVDQSEDADIKRRRSLLKESGSPEEMPPAQPSPRRRIPAAGPSGGPSAEASPPLTRSRARQQ